MKNDSDVMDNIPSRPVGERFNFGDVVLKEDGEDIIFKQLK